MARRKSWLQRLFGAQKTYRHGRSGGLLQRLGMSRGHQRHGRRGGWLSRILAMAGLGYLANRYYKRRGSHHERPATA